MAAAKTARGSLKNLNGADGLPIAFDDVMRPLGRAKAARRLLDALAGGNVMPPDEHADWVRNIALPVEGNIIQESEREYVKKAGTARDKAVASRLRRGKVRAPCPRCRAGIDVELRRAGLLDLLRATTGGDQTPGRDAVYFIAETLADIAR